MSEMKRSHVGHLTWLLFILLLGTFRLSCAAEQTQTQSSQVESILAQAQSPNLLFNGGFESSELAGISEAGMMGAWKTANGATIAVSDQEAHTGVSSLLVTRSAGNGRVQFEHVQLKPAVEYEFTVWVKRTANTFPGKMLIYQYGNKIDGASYPTISQTEIGTEWTQIRQVFRMPRAPSYDKVWVAFQFVHTTAVPDDNSPFYIDDFLVREIPRNGESQASGDIDMDNQQTMADVKPAIFIETTKSVSIPSGLSGVSLEVANTYAWRYDDPRLVSMLNKLDVGWLRYFGGNTNNFYDWKMGRITPSMVTQFTEIGLADPYGGMQMIAGVGGLSFPAFVELARKTGAKIIVTLNMMTDTVESIQDLVKYAADNHVRVEYWQLGNEPWGFLAHSKVPIYEDATDYLNRARPYCDAIKAIDPNAKTSIFSTVFSDDAAKDWLLKTAKYPDKYWDSVTFHDYTGGQGATSIEANAAANASLNNINDKLLQKVVASNWPGIPIISTEWNTSMRQSAAYGHRNTLYGGIYAAEFVARLSGDPDLNVDHLGYYNGFSNIISSERSYQYDAVTALEHNTVLDTTTHPQVDYQESSTVPGIALQLVNKAVNHSSAAMKTAVTSKIKVPVADAESMPALYAQAYRGTDGYNYLLVTNKSAEAQDVTIYLAGVPLSAKFTLNYISGNDPMVKNSVAHQAVTVMQETSGNPVHIRPYSVTNIAWATSGQAPEAPVQSHGWVSGPDEVNLIWSPAHNATGYRVGYAAPGQVYTWVDVGDVLSYAMRDLPGITNTNPQRVHFVVAAYNHTGTSAPGQVIDLAMQPPAVPLIRSIVSMDKALQVKWQSSSGATGYHVYVVDAGSHVMIKTIDVGNNLGCDISGLVNGTEYLVSVSAYNGLGASAPSSAVRGTPLATMPEAPHDVHIDYDSKAVQLQWTPSWAGRVYETFEVEIPQWTPAVGTWMLKPDNGTILPNTVYRNYSRSSRGSISLHNDFSGADVEIRLWMKVDTWFGAGKAGVVARYIDEDNYYAMVYDADSKAVKITKRLRGVDHTLISYPMTVTEGQYYLISLKVSGDELLGYWGRSKRFQTTDSDLAQGRIGLITKDQLAFFDKVEIFAPHPGETYNVLRSTQPDKAFTAIATGIAETRYIDRTVDSQSEYYYCIEAVNAAGQHSATTSLVKAARTK